MIYPINRKISNFKFQISNSQAGITLLLAILILSSVLAISFSLATVMFIEVRDSGDLLKTEPSLYAATGIGEQAFFNIERHICTGSGCSYTSGFSNNVSLNGVAILSTSTPIFIDKVKTGATFPNPLNNYYFCNAGSGASGCGYGKVTVSFITTNSNNYTLKAYLCEFNPQPSPPYSTAPCTLADKSQGYWNAPNGSDLSSLNSDGSVSMTASTNSSVSWTLNPSLQQQLILTNAAGQGDIYVKIATFADTYGAIGKGLPYVGETAVQVNTTNASVGRKIQVIVPNSASSGVAASLPVTTQFSVSGPASVAVGVPFSSPLEVRALDSNGNTVTGYTGTVYFSGGGGGASLPANYTFTGGDAGVHDFAGVTLNTAGTQTITVTDTGNSSITGTSNGILVVSSCNTSAVGTNQMVGCAFNDSDGSYLTNVNGNAPAEPVVSSPADNVTVLPDNNIMSGWSGMASGFQSYSGYPINYSMRWKGTFTFSGGNYSFSAGSDDGERVYVDGSKVWEAAWPGGRGYSVDTFTVPISAGSHIITYEYFQGGGGAEYSLSWAQITSVNGFAHRRSITVNGSKVSQVNGTTLSSFPVLVSVAGDANLATAANGGHVQNTTTVNGQTVPADLVFTSDSGCTSNLAWEVEKYGTSSGELEAWVKMPSLSNAGATFYMCYGNSSISSFQSTASAVWSNGYAGVWHLPNGSSLSTIDSTTNGANANNAGATATIGKIDGAANFSGTSMSTSAATPATTITLEAWAYPTQSGGQYIIFDGAGDQHFRLEQYSGHFNTIIGNGTWDYSSWCISAMADTSNNWYHLVLVHDGSGSPHTTKLYINGVLDANCNLSDTAILASASGTTIGAYSGGGANFGGKLDELRMSNIARSADWINTEYNNQNSPSSFDSVGVENP